MPIEPAFIQELEGAIAGASSGRRSEIVRKVTDLFIKDWDEFSPEDVSIFDDVISRLATVIERAARETLAKRLAPIRNAPPHTIRMLAFDDSIAVAEPVLAQSARLDDKDLVEIAKTKGQGHMLAISQRGVLSEAVTDVLVEGGDRDVVLGTVDNYGAEISTRGFAELVRRAEGDDTLAEFVGSRPEIAPDLLTTLVAQASDAVRAKLEAAHPKARAAVRRAVAEASDRVDVRAPSVSPEYAAALKDIAALQKAGRLDERAVAGFARSGAYHETVAALATMCDMPLQLVELAMERDRSETLLVLAKSLSLSSSTVKEILLMRANRGLISRGEIAQRLARFERLQAVTAQDIVHLFRARAQEKTAR